MSKSRKSELESKIDPISRFEQYYSDSIVTLTKKFLSGDEQAEKNFLSRLYFINVPENEILSKWVLISYQNILNGGKRADTLTHREQTFLGLIHLFNIGVHKNVAKATEFFKLAASKDTLGEFYLAAVNIHDENHLQYLKSAAERNKLNANSILGKYYRNQFDDALQKFYFEKGAQNDEFDGSYEWAMHCLSIQNFKEAIHYLNKAMENGNTKALIRLAEIYSSGNGIEQDLGKAALYYRRLIETRHIGHDHLQTLYENNKTHSAVLYQTTLALKNDTSSEFKSSLRHAFNELRRNNPKTFYELAEFSEDGVESIKPFLDFNDAEKAQILAANIGLNEVTTLNKEVILLILQYDLPFRDLVLTTTHNQYAFWAVPVPGVKALLGSRDNLSRALTL